MIWFLLLSACSGEDDGVPSTDVAVVDTGSVPEVEVHVDVGDPAQPLARVLTLSGPEGSATLWWAERGGTRTVTFDGVATEHQLPILGLPEGDHEVHWRLETSAGRAFEGVELVSLTLDVPLPDVTLQGDPDAATPGVTLAGVWSGSGSGRIIAIDADGRIVWVRLLSGIPKAAHVHEEGRFAWLEDGVAVQRDATGAELRMVGEERGYHHELVVEGDGSFWTLRSEAVDVDAFPVAVDQLDTLAPATLVDEIVVYADADGQEVGSWSMVERLDPSRVGFDSHDQVAGAYDWGHANAVVPLEDGFVVSLRHQDAVVAFDGDGQVAWILGNPDGWTEPLASLRLEPVGEVGWPYHQHGVKVEGDVVYVFDNGNQRRATPYTLDPEPPPATSRLVAYRVDPTQGTVEQLWALADPGLFSRAMGNIQALDATDGLPHALGTYPFLEGLDGVANGQAGRGDYATRILEWDVTTGERVWGVDLTGAESDAPRGWQADRATRIPSLYTGIATDRWDP